MSLSFTMTCHSRPPPRRMEHALSHPHQITYSSVRLPQHERDLPGGPNPLARGKRRLEARKGPGHARRAACAQIQHVRTRRHRHTQVPRVVFIPPNRHLVKARNFH